jgi:cyclopropane fatty-acyl-phospholipid synthase-like methyltransferase
MIKSSAQIWETAFGYREASVLFAAIDLRIFDLLKEQTNGATRKMISECSQANEQKLTPLLNVLCQMGLLIKADGKYRLSEASKQAGSDGTLSGIEKFRSELSEWANIAETLRSRRHSFKEDQIFTSEEISPYLDMVKASNFDRVNVVADFILNTVQAPKKILDIGGGHGLYSEKLLERCPDATATLQDLEAALSYADKHVSQSVRHRLHLTTGDARTHKEPAEYSIVMVNDLLHSFGHREKKQILSNAIGALEVGGTLFVGKFNMTDDDECSSQSNHMFSLKMALNSSDGYLETNTEVSDILSELGLKNVGLHDIPHDIPSVVVCGQKG